MSTPEGKIQLAICRHLRAEGFLFWRFSPQTYNATLGRHIKHEYIPNGLPDIMVLTDDGLVGLEVKGPRGKASADQLVMQRRFRSLGARYEVVRSVEDTIDVLS